MFVSFIMMKQLVFTLCCFIYPADGFQFWGSPDMLRSARSVLYMLVSWCHILHTGSTQQLRSFTLQSARTRGEIWVKIFADLRGPASTSRLSFVLFIIPPAAAAGLAGWEHHKQKQPTEIFSWCATFRLGPSQSSIRKFNINWKYFWRN